MVAKKDKKSSVAPAGGSCDHCGATGLGRVVEVAGRGAFCDNGRCAREVALGVPYSKWNR